MWIFSVYQAWLCPWQYVTLSHIEVTIRGFWFRSINLRTYLQSIHRQFWEKIWIELKLIFSQSLPLSFDSKKCCNNIAELLQGEERIFWSEYNVLQSAQACAPVYAWLLAHAEDVPRLGSQWEHAPVFLTNRRFTAHLSGSDLPHISSARGSYESRSLIGINHRSIVRVVVGGCCLEMTSWYCLRRLHLVRG